MNAPGRNGLVLALVLTLAVLAARTFTPYDLQETDQGKQAQYALDAVQNGHWLAPGCLDEAATKPPLYTWLVGLAAAVTGSLGRLTLRVPTALAALGLVVTTWEIGRRLAGPRVATAAAVALATSHHFLHLSGVVRTDGLLAFLLAAQVLVHVVNLARPRASWAGVLGACALAAAATLTKGPAGLLSCGVAGVHLAATGRRARVAREALLPALAGSAALAAWFAAASAARPDVASTMLEQEAARHAAGEGFPNPLYYVLAMPPRLGAWSLLAVPAIVLAARSLRRKAPGPAPEIVRLALSWLAVHLAVFSFFPHQRPDLIYPAEPAAMLLAGTLIERRLPAWTPRVLAALLALGAGIVIAFSARLFEDVPLLVVAGAALLLLAGAGATFALGRCAPALACFAGLSAAGLTDGLLQTLGDAPRAERLSTEAFGALAREESARRDVPLLATAVDSPATLFDLRIARMPPPARELAGWPGPVLVVVPAPAAGAVEKARRGPCAILARHAPPSSSRPPLVLLDCP